MIFFGPFLTWWFVAFLIGLISFPLAYSFLKNFWDHGYLFAKVIGLVTLSYLVWFTGMIKLLPFTRLTVIFLLLILAFLNYLLFRRQKSLLSLIKKNWPWYALEELIFLTGSLFWSFVRSHQPEINGLEKFMDFGFINAILRSRFFPPNDMWLAGKSINYYYFGHLQTAVLTRLSGLNPEVTYNLMLGTLCGLILGLGFSLTTNFLAPTLNLKTKKALKLLFFGGSLSALLLTFGGNLQILFHYFTQKKLSDYWYPDATRFIIEKFGAGDNNIHEFPSYSLVVADLHGHLLNLPTVFLILALIFHLGPQIPKQKSLKNVFPELVFLAFLFACAFMANAWDYPIYLLFFGMTVLILNLRKTKAKAKLSSAIKKTFYPCLAVVLLSILFFLPFYLTFDNIAQGVALVDFRSPLWMLPYLWGFPLFVSLAYFLFLFKNKKRVPEVFWQVLSLLIVSWILIILPEFIRIKDIYIHSHQRANTMFKLTYQAFVVFSLTYGFVLVNFLKTKKTSLLKKFFLLVFLSGTVIILVYPRFAINSYYDHLREFKGLDGLKYLGTRYPDDCQAILWLNQNVKGDPVIVEAVGESYTDYGRVSANTGLPTILGWRVHEWLWRGTFDIAGQRTEEVSQIYQGNNPDEVKKLLDQYHVKYIFVGSLEKEQYPQLNENNFQSLGKIAFSSGLTKIYEIQ